MTEDLKMDGINVIVKDEFAQPLSVSEMTKFIKHLTNCNIEFDKHDHMDCILK